MNAAVGLPRSTVPERAEETYESWKAAALAHDARSGAEQWKRNDQSRRFDYKVIRRRYDEIRAVKASGDPNNHFITSQTNPVVLWALRDSGGDDSLVSKHVDVYQTASKEWLRATYPFAMTLVQRLYPPANEIQRGREDTVERHARLRALRAE